MPVENSNQRARPAWAVNSSCMRFLDHRIELPSVTDIVPVLPSDVCLGRPIDRRLPHAPFFLGYALSDERNGVRGTSLWHHLFKQFWIVCEERPTRADCIWVFTRVCQTSSVHPVVPKPPIVYPPVSIISESWKRWDAFMDDTWASVQQKHVRFVPTEEYMRRDGTNMLFSRSFTRYIRPMTQISTITTTWAPILPILESILDNDGIVRPTSPALTEAQIRDWHKMNGPYEEVDEESSIWVHIE